MDQNTAERIATALERIADMMAERKASPGGQRPLNAQVAEYLELLREHAADLYGKMGLREIAFAIGVEVGKPQYKAFGMALTEYGAIKGTSGPRRYYYFGG
ncbi:hypothetical protein [Pseudomonas phage PPpW-3]|uniref:Uncharacterized protein n=1 Tax=Pseudomonas phage PPpW-3 TaxID=1279082 RepID=V5YSW6_9CAUD|nr:hypothetical protein X916_gp60 [Pseudomonas phage PPpW-3]BAO20660.1 hypothetical protein [Pseudomonas phage PPpW-3]